MDGESTFIDLSVLSFVLESSFFWVYNGSNYKLNILILFTKMNLAEPLAPTL